MGNDDPATRSRRKLDIIISELDAAMAGVAQDFDFPPPIPTNFSTNSLRLPGIRPKYAELVGGREVSENKLYRAFAILMDLMYEAADAPMRKAKPNCVPESAEAFIALMDRFAIDRAKEASWVLAHQMLPAFTDFYEYAKNNWPSQATRLKGKEWVPGHPTPDEQVASRGQIARLAKIVKSFGYDLARPDVQNFIATSLASRLYIVDKQGKRGPKRVAAEVAARLASLGGESFSGSTILHYMKSKRHIDKTASDAAFQFFLPNIVPIVSAADVLRGIAASRMARTYYLRYLIEEDAKRANLDEDASSTPDLGKSTRVRASAARLGLPPSAYLPDSSFGKTGELKVWNSRAAGGPIPVHLFIQTKPYDFQLDTPNVIGAGGPTKNALALTWKRALARRWHKSAVTVSTRRRARER